MSDQTGDAKLFAFRSGFWVNLHHFLDVLGRARIGTPDSRRAAVIKAPADLEGLSARPEEERTIWDEVVRADITALGLDAQLSATLKLAAPVYRAVWWARHSRANQARIEQLQALSDRHGRALVKRLTSVYGTQWPAHPRVIDVAAYSNWAGGEGRAEIGRRQQAMPGIRSSDAVRRSLHASPGPCPGIPRDAARSPRQRNYG